jgi:hypothetical protein
VETLVLALGAAGAVIAVLLAALHFDSSSMSPLGARRTPSEAGLTEILTAASGGRRVRVFPYSRGEYDSGVELAVEGLCSAVTLRRAPIVAAEDRVVRGLDTGDPEFDLAFESNGPPEQVRALLSAGTRKELQQLLTGSVRVDDVSLGGGELQVQVPTAGFSGKHPGLPQVARSVGELSRLLLTPEPVRQRLIANARQDPIAAVRLENLLTLARIKPRDAAITAELRAATADRDGQVRLRAAIALGPEGRDVLLSLAADEAVDDGCSADAVEALGRDFPSGRARALVERECRDPRRGKDRSATLKACLERLGAEKGSEATLIEALALAPEPARFTAVRALGDAGTASAVLPLKEMEKRGGDLGDAARQAIAEIQSRLTGSPGELSLAEGSAGSLSLADDASGRVSIPGPPAGDTDKR